MSLTSLQQGLSVWLVEAIGRETLIDPKARALRVFEEACELAQALGLSLEKAQEQLSHTYSRPVGEASQEVAGVLNSALLTAECLGLDGEQLGQVELARVWTKIDEVRLKNLSKVQP